MKKKYVLKNTDGDSNDVSRRHFLKITGLTSLAIPFAGFTDLNAEGVSIIISPDDAIAMSAPVQWAAKELEQALLSRGISVERATDITKSTAGNLCIAAGGSESALAKPLLKNAGTTIPVTAEALGLVPAKAGNRSVLLAAGIDERGLIYALLELTDRVIHASLPLSALTFTKAIVEKPANRVRGLNRLFVSDIEDKPWYNDREMWPQYLTMLATQRFNRFNLSLGIGYDFLRQVTDGYFLFSYPFLLPVPGYNVTVPELPDAERDNNLAMLRFISEQTVARGMEFQLGLWMHGYEWLNSPNPNYTIKGLTKENHAAYCRDAVKTLLQACPAISGITFRVHGESGVNEGSYDFWKTIFQGVAACGRTVRIDLHSKGIDKEMLDTALSVNLPLTVSPKYWAEHHGMPYHQTDIRELEVPKPDKKTSVLMNLSEGSRSFMRYGYGDLLKEDRKFDVLHRIWPGTQRLLLWGDPLTGAAQSRIFSFCGSVGVELMEPLSFKGRRGSGVAGDRCGYADATLKPRWDWEKYLYSLRIFGRTTYNPDTEPDVWRRYLRKQFEAGAEGVEMALAHATRILPTVLTSHAASAGNNNYWPEMYTNLPIGNANIKNPYTDTPIPKVFGTVSPLDPQLFHSINEFAKELLSGERTGKYSPIEAAQWIEDHADNAAKALAQAEMKSSGKTKPEYKRMAIDVSMQAGLGRFFASKFRSGVLYAIYDQTKDHKALEESVKMYRKAREQWATLANSVKNVYKSDVSAGEHPFLRGHWLDRLPSIDEDVADMTAQLAAAKPTEGNRPALVVAAVNACLGRPNRIVAACRHTKPQNFKAGNAVNLELSFDKAPKSVRLYYRHVNQGERYLNAEMKATGNRLQATIPADYTNSPFPLEYYFEIKEGDSATIYPGFGPQLKDQPYFDIRQA